MSQGTPFEDSEDPEKVTIQCQCGSDKSDQHTVASVNMKQLHEVYNDRCVKKVEVEEHTIEQLSKMLSIDESDAYSLA